MIRPSVNLSLFIECPSDAGNSTFCRRSLPEGISLRSCGYCRLIEELVFKRGLIPAVGEHRPQAVRYVSPLVKHPPYINMVRAIDIKDDKGKTRYEPSTYIGQAEFVGQSRGADCGVAADMIEGTLKCIDKSQCGIGRFLLDQPGYCIVYIANCKFAGGDDLGFQAGLSNQRA